MIGAIFQIHLKRREERETAQKGEEGNDRNRVVSRSGGQSNDAAGPKADGCGQTFDLVAGTEQNRIDADNSTGDNGSGGNEGEFHSFADTDKYIQHHSDRGCQGNQNERAKSGRVALTGSLTADDSG